MHPPIPYTVAGQKLWLSSHRCVFWEEQKTLILSDLHIGKTGHFRKAGIPVPQNVYKEDLQRLVSLLHHFGAQKLIAVGDLFHSKANLELEWFKKWRLDFPHLEVHLVKGNHDILGEEWYRDASITVWEEELVIENFRFTHEFRGGGDHPYTFCGHIHPGITLHGLGKQSLRFPCFYFRKDHCILPAFSKFTGTATVNRLSTDSIFALVENSVIPV